MLKRCLMCAGSRKMYETHGGLSTVNSGGNQIVCPICHGSGREPEPVETPVKKLTRKKNSGTIKKDLHESSSTN